MFTGLVSSIGVIRSVAQRGDRQFVIAPETPFSGLAVGASVCCSGVCLTATTVDPDAFAVDVSAETLSRSTLGRWDVGTRVNLERSLGLGDELGGHLVSGHVDGVGAVVSVEPDGDSQRWTFSVGDGLGRFVAEKGSVAIDGVSLTVNSVVDTEGGDVRFGINIIPHTREHTTFGSLSVGDPVNIEVDMLARYVARMLAYDSRGAGGGKG